GATGDDDAPPAPFDPLASEEGVAAMAEIVSDALVLVAGIAAAAAAAAGAAGSMGSMGSGTGSSNTGSNSSESGRRPEEESEEGEVSELEVSQDHLTLVKKAWGDKLALFTIPFITFFDKRSHNAAERIGNISPLVAKLINDAAYLRAMLGTISLVGPIAAALLAIAGVIDNSAAMAAGEFDVIITPPWLILLGIAVLGAFDASAGFVGGAVYILGSLLTAGHIPSTSEIQTMMAIMVLAMGPAILTTGFRVLRKFPATDGNMIWERIVDFAIAPFIAGWSTVAMVSAMPALAGLTLDVANHVNDFAFAIAAAIAIRVGLEEFVARAFPFRLNEINPDEIPDPSLLQRAIVLGIKYLIWVFIGGALVGESWQVWVGSALFLLPAVGGWFADRLPNSPLLWRILPTGLPGLAFNLFVASATTLLITDWFGREPAFAQYTFVLIPLPLLLLSVLGWFGREGATEDEDRPVKAYKWVYRIGGFVMLIVTLKLAGII
ncbi:MAG: hypothetical protein RI933_1241, partial [Actinomycetota bacterium]